jgi:hypothetical protein
MTDFRKAFPDPQFQGRRRSSRRGRLCGRPLGRWRDDTGPAFRDFLAGALHANTGRKMRFAGTTVLKLKDGKITEEIGLNDGVAALQQLGLIKLAA